VHHQGLDGLFFPASFLEPDGVLSFSPHLFMGVGRVYAVIFVSSGSSDFGSGFGTGGMSRVS
jgi:hypothetical protein